MTPMFLEKDESEKLLSIPAGLAFHYFCILCNYCHFFVSPSSFENFVCMNGAKPMSKHFFQFCHILIFCIFDFGQESTVHGVRYFIDGENALHKFAWVVIMVCSVRLCSQYKILFWKLKKILYLLSWRETNFRLKLSAIFRLGFLHTWSTMLGSNHFTKMHQNSRAKNLKSDLILVLFSAPGRLNLQPTQLTGCYHH